MVARPRRETAPTLTPCLEEGIYELPAGHVAAVATYLEMYAPPPRAETSPVPAGSRFDPLGDDVGRYRRLYSEVGQDWLWFSRALMADGALRAVITHPKVEVLAFVVDGRDTGIVELDFRKAGRCELAFLGLVPSALGHGWGAVLVTEAIRRAFARTIDRLWLHTCTLDHPGAVRFYVRSGFRPYRRAIEIVRDPRLCGAMKADAAPRFPVV